MVFQFDVFEFDARSYRLLKAGEVVHMEPQVAQLLALLIERHGKIVDREEIQRVLWADRIVASGLIDNRIRALRSALGDDGRSQKVIKTFPNKGYTFVAQVEEEQHAEPVVKPAARARWTKRNVATMASLTGVLASLVLLALPIFETWTGQASAAKTVPDEVVTQASSERRVAVLDFAGASEFDARLGTDLSRKTIEALAKLQPIGVISQHSSFAMDNDNETLPQIASALGANYLITGTISSDADIRHATVELISAGEDKVLWAETFAAPKADQTWMEFQTRVSQRIVLAVSNGMGVPVEGHEPLVLNPESLEHFENGLLLINSETAQEIDQSLEHFAAVVNEEPNFLPGHMYLAVALEQAVSAASMDRDDAIARATASSVIVASMSPDSLEHKMILGTLARLHVNNSLALKYFNEVLVLRPDFVIGLLRRAKTELDAFRYDEALESYSKALSLNPLSTTISLAISEIYFSQGNIQEAREQVQKTLLWDPNNLPALVLAAEFEMNTGNYLDAIQMVQHALSINPNDLDLQFIAYQLYNGLGLLDELESILTDPGFLGMVAALRGDRERAFAYARQDRRAWTASYVAYLFGDTKAIYEVLTRLGISDAYLSLKRPILIDQMIEAAFLVDAFKREGDPKAQDMEALVNQYLASKSTADLQIQEEFSGVAGFYAITGQLDKAFEVLDEANRRKLLFISRLERSPHFENLRADSGFEMRYQTMLENRDQLFARCAQASEYKACFQRRL